MLSQSIPKNPIPYKIFLLSHWGLQKASRHHWNKYHLFRRNIALYENIFFPTDLFTRLNIKWDSFIFLNWTNTVKYREKIMFLYRFFLVATLNVQATLCTVIQRTFSWYLKLLWVTERNLLRKTAACYMQADFQVPYSSIGGTFMAK
jgi:hypothetical protein